LLLTETFWAADGGYFSGNVTELERKKQASLVDGEPQRRDSVGSGALELLLLRNDRDPSNRWGGGIDEFLFQLFGRSY
jgi:hypothetical protein